MVSRMLAVRDEQHLGEVEGQVDVVVLEGVVLLGVQHLEQGGGRVAAEVRADLVHLVEHEDRVLALRAAQPLDDLAGQGADVGAAVAADLRLVAHAAQADAVELAAHGGGDGLAEAGLAHARRAHEAEDRPLDVRLHLADGQVLEDALLDLLEVVVVVVQDLLGLDEVDLGLRPLAPGQRHQPVQVGAGHGVLGGGGGHLGEAVQLAEGLLLGLLGHARLLDLLAQLVVLALLVVALAQLLLDGLHLLAQVVLALVLLELASSPGSGSCCRPPAPRGP